MTDMLMRNDQKHAIAMVLMPNVGLTS